MARPRKGQEAYIKRAIRYLKGHRRCINRMGWQDEPSIVTVFVDSDWAGDRKTRKSTSGGCVMYGDHLIMHWSKMQGNVALSSGEAELNAAVKGVSEGIGIIELCLELGFEIGMKLATDATVCKSILLRHGAGKIKHLTTKQLWVQGAIETYKMKIVKVPRDSNGADLLTHGCSVEDLRRHLKLFGLRCKNECN